MAQGDIVVFEDFRLQFGLDNVNLDTGTVRLGLVTSAASPAANSADPRWGAGGTTNFSTNEVTPGGNYAAGGPDISGVLTESAGTVTFDASDLTILENGSNPTNARWGIVYVDDANDYAVAYVDLGSTFDMTTGDLVFTWNASGLFDIS